MNPSRITMSRPLNVPTGGRSIRTRRKLNRAPAQTRTTPARMTPNSVAVSWNREIGWVLTGMSRSRGCEGDLVQVAPGAAQRRGLLVRHDDQVHIGPEGSGQLPARLGLAEAADRRRGQRELDPAVECRGPVTGGPGRGGQRL